MKSLALLVGGLGVVVEGSSGDNYLGGARDLVYDSERELVLIAAIHGTLTILDVADRAQPSFVSYIAPSSVQDAHGLAYDSAKKRVFVASVTESSVTCIDTSDPYNPTVISTISNSTWLFYSTHLSFDPVRSLLFVASAGNGTEGSGV
eukprot:gene30997-2596_t